MIKLQLILRPHDGEGVAPFANRVVGSVGPALLAAGPAGLTLTLTVERPPRLAVVPFRRAPVALVSLWTPDDDPPRQWADRVLEAAGPGRAAGWRVDESVPVESLLTWPAGTRSPGVGLLTLLRRRRGLSDEELVRRWHGGHTPLSLRLHPLWRYVRNVTREPVVDGSPPVDGIVEEHFRDRRDLLRPLLFFGGPWAPRRSAAACARRMLPAMARTAVDIAGFIDLPSLETYLVEEYRLRHPAP
jgi:hypothetical protein